ncbi:hypothetical protein OF83DRAFT_1180900 [Amylostereum chailletii]|nr:hypothetical protein OF83DRAFT_1180900 [Amylostereum chailletii]
MLNNPDIAPGASSNRWIISILMFHFRLVHVPGIFHGRDGLSRRVRQPGDLDDIEDDKFDDWIDRLHGFMHMINIGSLPSPLPLETVTFLQTSFVHSVPEVQAPSSIGPSEDNPSVPLETVLPRSEATVEADFRLKQVSRYLQTLERPPGLSDAEFSTFLRYCLDFFCIHNQLWRRHPSGANKIVVWIEDRLRILTQLHDDIGHKGIFATTAMFVK